MNKRRIVITGMGAVTPIGKNVPTMWQSIQQGKSGVAPITLFDASNSSVKIAAEIKDFKPEEHGIDPKEARRMARFTQETAFSGGIVSTFVMPFFLQRNAYSEHIGNCVVLDDLF